MDEIIATFRPDLFAGKRVLISGASTGSASPSRKASPGLAPRSSRPAAPLRSSVRRGLEQDPTLASALALGRRAPVICFGMGAISPGSVLVQSGFVSEEEAVALKAKGAVGDILSSDVGAQGNIVDPELDARTIGLDLRFCREREFSIGVGAGKSKHAITLACLARYLNVLVTDERTALFLLDEAHHG
jgi:deoxyribonucleoside regulator